ncbi:MAG: DUF4339 domain-containing protein [Candidatus Angelobacter sp.]
MKYYIQRQLNEYGPYTLADLQRYLAQGSILTTDLTRSEGMTEWVPVSQVIGNIPIPVAMPAVQAPVYGGVAGYPGSAATVYGGGGTVYSGGQTPAAASGPFPPDFHWALVLLITLFCGVFQLIWLFIEAGFVKKIDPENKSIGFLVGGIGLQVLAFIVLFSSGAAPGNRNDPLAFAGPFLLFLLGAVVLHFIGIFKMRSSLEDYYNRVEPINLRLSGVMTFFFAVYYFQYHFSRIAAWKKTGYLQPQ